VGEIIPFRRIKTIVIETLAARFAPVERTPPKAHELRAGRPEGRILAKLNAATVPLGSLADLKFVARARRHAKLHLFRMWKLFGEVKAAPMATVYRPVAERIREAGSMMRL
jgi:hypothetical protein